MRIKNVMLFCYDFPHKKTQDFILRLLVEGYTIKYVIAAPWKKLTTEQPAIRIAPSHTGLIHPQKICQRFEISYKVFPHESPETTGYIKGNPVDLFIISGARILPNKLVEEPGKKILNIHPGLLPEVRGMDTLLWSIYHNVPIGITAHFISSRIDSGIFIYKEKLRLYKTDALIDVSLRLLEKQPDILIKALDILKSISPATTANLDTIKSRYNKKMSSQQERETIAKFQSWLDIHANQ